MVLDGQVVKLSRRICCEIESAIHQIKFSRKNMQAQKKEKHRDWKQFLNFILSRLTFLSFFAYNKRERKERIKGRIKVQ